MNDTDLKLLIVCLSAHKVSLTTEASYLGGLFSPLIHAGKWERITVLSPFPMRDQFILNELRLVVLQVLQNGERHVPVKNGVAGWGGGDQKGPIGDGGTGGS